MQSFHILGGAQTRRSKPQKAKRQQPHKMLGSLGDLTLPVRSEASRMLRVLCATFFQNCLQWGRSNLVDPAESPRIRLLNRDLGTFLSISPRRNSKTLSSLNLLQSGPRKFTKSDFSGLAPDPASSDFFLSKNSRVLIG